MQLSAQREPDELVRFQVVDCFREEEEGAYHGDASEGGLEPKYDAPGGEGYDYAAYEGAECWAWVGVSFEDMALLEMEVRESIHTDERSA